MILTGKEGDFTRRRYSERLDKKAYKMAIYLTIRDLPPHERSRMVDELAEREHTVPFSIKKSYCRATIYNWSKKCKESNNDFNVLVHKERSDKNKFRVLSEEQKDALMRWRFDNVYRTVKKLREELLAHPSTCYPVPSESTIARFLKSVNLDRKTLLRNGTPSGKVRLPYQAPYPQYLWVADTKGPKLYVKDPDNPEGVKQAKLIVFMDDNSRHIVGAHYVFDENEIAVMLLFQRAISLYGVPNSLYTDRGGPYMGASLKRAASLLGCRVIHTKPKDAPAKGKIERIMLVFYEQLESELALLPDIITIEQANEYLLAFIWQDYHRSIHSVTGKTPEEMFFSFPEEYRRFVSANSLAMVFLPVKTSRVTKTGLIHLNNLQYMVPSARLYEQWVEVRYYHHDRSLVHVWFEDTYYGEAHVYIADNDYAKRQELIEKLKQVPEVKIPDISEVPLYSYLERKLAAHRQALEEADLNKSLLQLRAKKEEVKAALVNVPVQSPEHAAASANYQEFGVDSFEHLLTVLLRRAFESRERLTIHTVWRSYGPFEEELVRKTVGRLLGEGHPISDLAGYLDALRIAQVSQK